MFLKHVHFVFLLNFVYGIDLFYFQGQEGKRQAILCKPIEGN